MIGEQVVWNTETSLRVSKEFNKLVESITSKSPIGSFLKQFPRNLLGDEDLSKIDFIKANTDPQELTAQIFRNPPQVHIISRDGSLTPKIIDPKPFIITQPSQKDLKIAHKITPVPESVQGVARQSFEIILDASRRYLQAPTIDDGLTSHELERQPWKQGVMMTLRLFKDEIDNSSGWNDEVNNIMLNNRYRGSIVTTLIGYIDTFCTYQKNSPALNELNMIKGRLLTVSNKFKDKSKVDEAVRSTVQECINIINLFAAE